jgi:hypothetical protein
MIPFLVFAPFAGPDVDGQCAPAGSGSILGEQQAGGHVFGLVKLLEIGCMGQR